jgi:hypothetical protein
MQEPDWFMCYRGLFNSSILQEYSGKRITASFVGCASCNMKMNVATTHWSTSAIQHSGNSFCMNVMKEDGEEEVDWWLG